MRLDEDKNIDQWIVATVALSALFVGVWVAITGQWILVVIAFLIFALAVATPVK